MTDQLCNATLALLADGAFIEQTATAPIAYRIVYQGDSAPLPASIVQRLQTSQKIRESSIQVNGRKRLYLEKNAHRPVPAGGSVT